MNQSLIFEAVKDGQVGHISNVYAFPCLEDPLHLTFNCTVPWFSLGKSWVSAKRKRGNKIFMEHRENSLQT